MKMLLVYPIGIKYYEIKRVSTSEVIAVEDGNSYVKAEYSHKTPFHIMNLITNPVFLLLSLLVLSFSVIRNI